MIGETLNMLVQLEKDVRRMRRTILDWAEPDKMSKDEWNQFVAYLVEQAETRGMTETVGDARFYRADRWILFDVAHGDLLWTKCEDPYAAAREFERMVFEAHRQEATASAP